MKKFSPEDLSLKIRNVEGQNNGNSNNINNRVIVETKDGCNTRDNCFTINKCDTQNDCDTLDDCVTNIYCDTDGACKTATCSCGNTSKCQTSACGDTQTKAVICCAKTDGSDCAIYTRICSQTNQCLVSRDVECQATIPDCVMSSECEETQVCPITAVGCN